MSTIVHRRQLASTATYIAMQWYSTSMIPLTNVRESWLKEDDPESDGLWRRAWASIDGVNVELLFRLGCKGVSYRLIDIR